MVKFSRRLRRNWTAYCTGLITFAELDASINGWINHVRYADTWRLRNRILGRPLPGRPPRPPARHPGQTI